MIRSGVDRRRIPSGRRHVQPDNNLPPAIELGFGQSSVGRFHVAEGFGELAILSPQNMPFAEDLTIQAATASRPRPRRRQ
jgi:hypothetical protein